jgi:hypothetical protein
MFVHGYSESSLGAYFTFPERLKGLEPSIQRVALAAFDSLDDSITIDDLASAMETRVSSVVEAGNWSVADSAIICHSTGALVARRWILNRLAAGKELPSHFITMAGANHGSTLAGMGKSVLGYFQKLVLHHEWSVGQGVLTDLDYGSDFLLDLNREWLEQWNNGGLSRLYAFSMGGDTRGNDLTLDLFWQTHESGSDNTVRISGANLNYTIIDVEHDENGTTLTSMYPTRRVPHLILTGYSHYGPQTGILGKVDPQNDAPMNAVRAALSVATPAQYAALEQAWRVTTVAWTNAHTDDANSTAIFTLLDRNRTPVGDCIIAVLDQQALGDPANATLLSGAAATARATAMQSAGKAVLRHSPIHNNVQVGSYTFYFNFAAYFASSPHWFDVEFGQSSAMGRNDYPYAAMLFTQPTDLEHTIAPNETTYIHMSIGRASNEAYAIWRWDPGLNLDTTTFPPFDSNTEYRIAPPSPNPLEGPDA